MEPPHRQTDSLTICLTTVLVPNGLPRPLASAIPIFVSSGDRAVNLLPPAMFILQIGRVDSNVCFS